MANFFSAIGDAITKGSNKLGKALDGSKALRTLGGGISGFFEGSIKSIPGAIAGALGGIGGGIPGIVAGAIAGGAPTVIAGTVNGVKGSGGDTAVLAGINGVAGTIGDVMAQQGGTVGNVGQIISSASSAVDSALMPKTTPTPPVVSGDVTIGLPNGGEITIGGKSGGAVGAPSSSGSGSGSGGGWKDKYNDVTDALYGSIPIVYPFQRKG